MVQTRNSDNNNPPDPIATQLAAIAAKLEAIETMKEDIAALKEGERSRSRGSKNFEGESSWRGRQQYRPYKYNKIDFPIFSGGDPRGWLLKAEKYFRYYQIPDEEKVEIASMHLEGDALDLYSWLSDGQVIFWEELVQAFTKNFGPAEFQNPDEFLCSIKQTGSVQEYRQEFAKRSSRVSNWPDHCLLGVFLNGLKDELKSDEETAEISLHAILGKPHPTTMKVHATQPLAPFGVQIGNRDVIRCGQICKNLPVQINDLKITQDFHPFSFGGADLVLGIQWLATLNTVQANCKELFMIFSIDGKRYKLEGIVTGPQKSSNEMVVEQFLAFRLEDKAFYREGSNDKDPLKMYSRKRNRSGIG
ncbi:retrotransposon gag domain, retroviral aspartyl protease [Tanacetum coccineum]